MEIIHVTVSYLRRIRRCAAEILVVVLWGLIPAVVLTLRSSASADGTNVDNVDKFLSQTALAFTSGQLYLYSFSIWGTILWLVTFGSNTPRNNTKHLIILILVVLVIGVSGIGGFDPTFKTSNSFVIQISYYCFFITLFIYFVALWIENPAEIDFGKELSKGSDELVAQYRKIEEPSK